MDLIPFLKRRTAKNPIHPYSWEVRYRDGTKLKQFDFDGYHKSIEIDKARVVALVVLGHPASPIDLPAPYPDRTPDDVVIKAQVSMNHTLGVVGFDRMVRCFFGFQYGGEKFYLLIDETGKLWKTNTEEEEGVAIVSGSPMDHIRPMNGGPRP